MDNKVLEKIKKGRQYRNLQNFEAREDNENEKVVEGYATTFNERYLLFDTGDFKCYEEVDSHAFDECDMSDCIMQYDHQGRVFARVSNDTLGLKCDDHGLKIRANLGGTEIGRQLYEEIRGGYTTKMSFGFTVNEDIRTIEEDKENGVTTVLRTITKVGKLYDVSSVSLPANDGTEISARDYFDGVIDGIKAERLLEAQKREALEKQKQRIRILANL